VIYDIVIIGGGASGLMLAANLRNKKRALLIESTNRLGNKILISGGGRCNFTNKSVTSSDYLGDKNFFNSIYKSFDNRYILEFFKSKNLQYIIKNGSEYFCKNSAKELLDILLQEIKPIETKLNCKVESLQKDGDIFTIKSSKGDIKAKKVVVATGGLSFAKIGASGIGLEIAKGFGHNIITPSPALVGLTLQKEQSFFKDLSGISLDVSVKVANKRFDSKMLFAHKGITGPAILNASLFWSRGKIEIDFLPGFNIESIKGSKKELATLLPIPKRASKLLLQHIDIKNKNANKLTATDLQKLQQLKSYSFAPAGTFGYSKAEATKGGIDTSEIDSKTLMSKKVDNLYFLGELLDITGRVGGYNFQWAFSSALKCAKYIQI
jgi:predicted Rossmann fold flavoprotein